MHTPLLRSLPGRLGFLACGACLIHCIASLILVSVAPQYLAALEWGERWELPLLALGFVSTGAVCLAGKRSSRPLNLALWVLAGGVLALAEVAEVEALAFLAPLLLILALCFGWQRKGCDCSPTTRALR